MTDDNSSQNDAEITGSFKTQYVNTESFNKLQSDVEQLNADLTDAKNMFEKSRLDLITLLGVFVGLITYLGLEIQVFKIINNPLMIIGISIFFIASILLFILTMNEILKKSETARLRDFKNPLYGILMALLLISMGFILYGHHDFSQKIILLRI